MRRENPGLRNARDDAADTGYWIRRGATAAALLESMAEIRLEQDRTGAPPGACYSLAVAEVDRSWKVVRAWPVPQMATGAVMRYAVMYGAGTRDAKVCDPQDLHDIPTWATVAEALAALESAEAHARRDLAELGAELVRRFPGALERQEP